MKLNFIRMRTALTELSDEPDQQPKKEGRRETGNKGPQEREDHRRETGELCPLYRMLVEIPWYWNADRTNRTDRQQQKNQRKKEKKTTSDWRKGELRRRGLGQLNYLLVEVQLRSLAYRTYGTVRRAISKKKKKNTGDRGLSEERTWSAYPLVSRSSTQFASGSRIRNCPADESNKQQKKNHRRPEERGLPKEDSEERTWSA